MRSLNRPSTAAVRRTYQRHPVEPGQIWIVESLALRRLGQPKNTEAAFASAANIRLNNEKEEFSLRIKKLINASKLQLLAVE